MGWSAVPDEVADKRFGQVTLEQQARLYAVGLRTRPARMALGGVVNTWFMKRATDEWFRQGRPEAYFRLADPDFTLQPVYERLKTYITGRQGPPTP